MKWIVIVALSWNNLNSVILTENTSNNTNSSYNFLQPKVPTFEIFLFDSKEEAEQKAINYIPINGTSCSHSSLIISPKGEIFSVKYEEQFITVLKEVKESIGYTVVWTPEIPK